jgi:Fic family protein
MADPLRDEHGDWLHDIAVPLPDPDINERLEPKLKLFDREIEAWRTTRTMRAAAEAFGRLQYWSEALASMQVDAVNDNGTTLVDTMLEGCARARYGDRKQSLVNAARMSQAARLVRGMTDPGSGERAVDGDLLCDLHFHVMGRNPDGPGRPGRWRSCEMDIVDHRDGQVWNTGVRSTAIPETMEQFAEAFDQERWAEYHPLVRASWAHLAFERIHPFTDGNGRVGRLMVDGIHREYRLPMVPLNSVLEDRRPDYHDHMSDAIHTMTPAHYAEFHIEASVQAARHMRTHAREMEGAIEKVEQATASVEDIGGPRTRRLIATDLVSLPVLTEKDLVVRHRREIGPEQAKEIFGKLQDAGLGEHRQFDRPLNHQGRAGPMFVVTCGLQAVRPKPDKLWQIEQNPPDIERLKREDEAARTPEDPSNPNRMPKSLRKWHEAERARQYKKNPEAFNFVGSRAGNKPPEDPER